MLNAETTEPKVHRHPMIAPLTNTRTTIAALTTLLTEAVALGASVSFMHPLAPEAAAAFWTQSLTASATGARILLGAHEADALIGTVTLLLDTPPNQPHRAEISKLIVRPTHRGQGIATALMREAERLAQDHARTLLVLDTAVDGGAAPFYEKLGYHLTGEIPDYALKPHGGLTGTLIYYKRL
jgi:ribosomal protein S18 acetylase RimI-like enzyme